MSVAINSRKRRKRSGQGRTSMRSASLRNNASRRSNSLICVCFWTKWRNQLDIKSQAPLEGLFKLFPNGWKSPWAWNPSSPILFPQWITTASAGCSRKLLLRAGVGSRRCKPRCSSVKAAWYDQRGFSWPRALHLVQLRTKLAFVKVCKALARKILQERSDVHSPKASITFVVDFRRLEEERKEEQRLEEERIRVLMIFQLRSDPRED